MEDARTGRRGEEPREEQEEPALPAQSDASREDRPGRTRLAAATTEFARAGYGAARVEAVARAARVAEGTVYYLFGSKRGLLRISLKVNSHFAPS